MQAVSIRVESRKSSGTSGDRSHNERIGKQPDYVDSQRSHLNSILMPMPTATAIKNECHARRISAYEANPEGKRAPKSMRKDAVISISGIITFSHEAQPIIEQLTPEEQNRRLMEAVKLAAKKLGTDIAGVSVHRDESALHAHFSLYGYDKRGEPVSRRLKKATLSELQDEVAKAFDDLGITRGKRISERIAGGESVSKTIHRSVRELHRDLPQELEQAKAQLAELQEKFDKNEGLAKKAQEKLDATAQEKTAEIAKLQKRISVYTSRAAAAKAELTALNGDSLRMDAVVTRLKKSPEVEKIKQKTSIFRTEERRMVDVRNFSASIDAAFKIGKQYAFSGYNANLESENERLKTELATIEARHDAEIQRLESRHTQALAKVKKERDEQIRASEAKILAEKAQRVAATREVERLQGQLEEVVEQGLYYESELIDADFDYFQRLADQLEINDSPQSTPRSG